jgi:hypothetical protein
MAEVEDDFGDEEEEEEEEEELVRPKSIYDVDTVAITKAETGLVVAATERTSITEEFTTAEAARTMMANRAYDDLTTSASSFYVDKQIRREDLVKPEKQEREWWEFWAARSPLYQQHYQLDAADFPNCNGVFPVVQNVDVIVNLGSSIDLTQVARKLPNCEYVSLTAAPSIVTDNITTGIIATNTPAGTTRERKMACTCAFAIRRRRARCSDPAICAAWARAPSFWPFARRASSHARWHALACKYISEQHTAQVISSQH